MPARGRHSVWTTFSSCVWLAAVASLDTTCPLNQNLCLGADSRMAMLVAWLEAIGALSNEAVKAQLTASRNAITVAKQIVYAVLDAQTYLVGSPSEAGYGYCGACTRRLSTF